MRGSQNLGTQKAMEWWSRWDSNPRPPRCHRGALPTAPRPHRKNSACSYSTREQRASTHASGGCAQDQNSFEIAARIPSSLPQRSLQLETLRRQIPTPKGGKTVALGALPTKIPPHAQNHLSWRRRHGYRLKISDRSGRKTAAGGLRPLRGLQGSQTAQLGAAGGRSSHDRLGDC